MSVHARKQHQPLLPELALIAATLAYGGTFKIVQDGLEHVTPVGFILLRFVVGTIALTPLAIRRGWRRDSSGDSSNASLGHFWLAAVSFGVVGFAGYWLQNAGLQRTTTSNSAFITGLFVVFTPLVETAVTRRAPSRNVLVGVVVSAVGLFLLTGASFSLGVGDALTLGCALMFAIWIFLGATLSQHFDPVALTAVQMAFIAVCAAPVVWVTGLGEVTASVIVAVVFTGVVCSAIAFTLQLWGQRSLEASRAAVILLFEPVVAGFVGFFVGERLGFAGYLGSAVIFGGILIAESHAWRRGRAELPT